MWNLVFQKLKRNLVGLSKTSERKIFEKQHQVVFILGPTASGKSDLAIKLALDQGGVIINCDSVQVYQDLVIGSAQPSLRDQSLCPHYLYSYVPFGHEMTAGQYTRDFYQKINEIPSGQKIFVVGGTGFYFQAIEKGMYPVRQINLDVKNQVDKILLSPNGPRQLYEELRIQDPDAASKISINDHYRLGRAIELIRSEGRTLSEIKSEFASQQKPLPFPLIKIGLSIDKEELAHRILTRSIKMIENGLIDECHKLLTLLESSKENGNSGWGPLGSVGYKETINYIINGKSSLSELSQEIFRSTMRLAKKQKTWFQRDQEIHWINAKDLEKESKALHLVRSFFK